MALAGDQVRSMTFSLGMIFSENRFPLFGIMPSSDEHRRRLGLVGQLELGDALPHAKRDREISLHRRLPVRLDRKRKRAGGGVDQVVKRIGHQASCPAARNSD